MKLWRNNLLFRLVGYFLLVSTISTAAIGLFAYYLAEQTLTDRIYDQLNSVAIIKEEELYKWVAQQQAASTYVGELNHIQAAAQTLLQLELADLPPDHSIYAQARETMTDYLRDVSSHNPAFLEMLVMTKTGGKVVASTNEAHVGQYRVHDTYFKEGLAGPFTQKPYISPHNGRPAMSVSRPIRDEAGKVLGVFAIHLNLTDIDNIVNLPSSLAQTGEIYLVDQNNAFFSSLRLGSEAFPRGVHSTGINRAISGQSGYAIYENYNGVAVIGTYRWLDELGLALLAEIPVTEAFAPAQRLAVFILGVGAAVTLVLGLAVYLLARRITQPILSIADTAVAIAAGNLSVTAPVTSSDEVGTLARTFNQMVSQLKTLYAGLEQKVKQLQEKEQALQQYARRLEAQHEIDRAILKAQLPRDIGLAALNHLHDLIHCARSSIFLFEREEAFLIASINQTEMGQVPEKMTFHISQLRSYSSLLQGESFISSDIRQIEQPSLGQEHLKKLGVTYYISLPLMARDMLIGSLNLARIEQVAFSKEDITIAGEVANQLAIALQQAQLLAATQRQLQELSVLHAVGQASTEAAHEDELLERATEAIATLLPADNFGVMMLTENGRFLQPHHSYHGQNGRVNVQFPITCISPTNTAHTQNIAHTHLFNPNSRSHLCIPLHANNTIIGIFNAESRHPDAFSDADEQLLITLANQLAIAIEKLRLLEQTQKEINERRRVEKALREAHDQLEQRVAERTSELVMLNRAAQTLISSLEIEEVLISVLDELRRLLNARASAVWLVEETSGDLICLHSSGKGNEAIRNTRLPVGTGIVGWVAQSGQSDLTQDAAKDERHYTFPDNQPINLATRSLLSVPLRLKEQTIGVLQVLDTEPNRFSQSDIALVESLAASAAFAIENARLYKQAREDAETKSVLLREVNHRVKNNLSAIIGILYAERRHADLEDQPIYQTIMQDLISRVQGLAAVHSMLTRSQWGPVPLCKMTNLVINSSLRALPSPKRILFSVDQSDIMVLPNQASNLALVINELTTNSMKYALKNRATAHITVKISQHDQMVRLIFEDDGPGFPADVLEAKNPRYNVGFHLIQNLVKRGLKGNLTLQNKQNGGSGSSVIIEFRAAHTLSHTPTHYVSQGA